MFSLLGDGIQCGHNLDVCDDHYQTVDFVNVTCELAYNGGVAPELQWEKNGGDKLLNYRVVDHNTTNAIVSSLIQQVSSDLMNILQYNCSVIHPFGHVTVANQSLLPPLRQLREYTVNILRLGASRAKTGS